MENNAESMEENMKTQLLRKRCTSFTPKGSNDKEKETVQVQQWPQAFSLDVKKKNSVPSFLQSI